LSFCRVLAFEPARLKAGRGKLTGGITVKNHLLPRLLHLLLATSGMFWVPAWGQEILIGHVSGYTGPATKDAVEMGLGGKVLIDSVNARGGVLGKKLRLVTADDHFKPEETAKHVNAMAAAGVSALLPTTGSANMTYLLKEGVLEKLTLPIVGTIPANETFRNPIRKNIFHFRAGDRDQLAKIIEHLTTIGITNIAVLARTGSSGAEGTAIVVDELQRRGLKPVAQVTYDVAIKDSYSKQAKLMQDLKPGAIVLLGTPLGIAEQTKELKKQGVTSMLYAVSYADFKLIAKLLGPDARGFVISQVLPNLNNKALFLIKAFQEDFAKYSGTKEEPTHFNLEGYMSARLIVEAIGRSKDASPQGVIKGLEQLREWDMGGYIVDFSPKKHIGSGWVDLSMIRASGTLAY
jgi:branched-chain amino acid transport system substrate-binding protein